MHYFVTVHEMRKIGLLMDTDITVPGEQGGGKVLSQFVHLSIQEFLAMAGLLKESPDKVRELIQEFGRSEQFNMALLFLYGLVYNDDNDSIRRLSTAVVDDSYLRREKKKALLEGVAVSFRHNYVALKLLDN